MLSIIVAIAGGVWGAVWTVRAIRDERSVALYRFLGAGLGPVILTVVWRLGRLPPPATSQVLLAIPVGFAVGFHIASRAGTGAWLRLAAISSFVLFVVPLLPGVGLLLLLALAFALLVSWLRDDEA